MPVRHAWNVLRHCFPSGIAIVVPLLLCLAVVPAAQADSSTPVTATVTAYYNGDYFCPGGAGNCPGGLYPACDGGNSSGPYGQLIANLDAGDTFAGTDSVSAGDSMSLIYISPLYPGASYYFGNTAGFQESFSYTPGYAGAVYGCLSSAGTGTVNATITSAGSTTTPPAPPAVNAGPAQTVHGETATLTGSASSATGVSGTTWVQLSGPGTAAFSSGSALQTNVSVTAPGTYVFQLVAVGDDGLSATSNVQVTFLTRLSVTAVLSDVPIRPDPGTSASEKLTITVTNPNGSPAAGASVTISSAPRVIYRTNAQGQVAISLAVNLDTTPVKISATADGQTASINQTLREVTTQSCTVQGTVVTVLQLSLDLLGPEAEIKGLLDDLKLIIDLLSKGVSGVKALHTPATTKLIQYTVAIPGAPNIYALEEQLFDKDGRQIGHVGPYYSSSPADPDPAVCVLGTAG